MSATRPMKISGELLLTLFQEHDLAVRRFRVVKDAVPADARIVMWQHVPLPITGSVIELLVASDTWPADLDGVPFVPECEAVFEWNE